MGDEGITPLTLNLGLRWRIVVKVALRPLYSERKRPHYSIDRRPAGPQRLSGCAVEEKN
jgi:hypothetical protein